MNTPSYLRDGNTIFAVEIDPTTGHDVSHKVAVITKAGQLQPSKGCAAHREGIEAFLADIGDEIAAPAGQEVDAPSTQHEVPPCPPEDPASGDKTPAVVAWWYQHHPEQAAKRYQGRKFERPA